MTSKEFLEINPFGCKFIIGAFARCKQEIKWVCEKNLTVINTHFMTVEELADMINGNVDKEKISSISKIFIRTLIKYSRNMG